MRVLGLDGGIASVGWAMLDIGEERMGILGCGARTFDAPETDKERKPTSAVRRLHRGQRRVIRRRRQRMALIRHLFAEHGLLRSVQRDALHVGGVDPWELRAAGLERQLEPSELAIALGHIARHRGFRSNSKRDRGANAGDESSKMLRAIAVTQERLGQWQTAGLMFARDPNFADRKRNRAGEFSRSVLRSDLEQESRLLFQAQRRLGSPLASEGLEAHFAEVAFSQRPLQDSEHRIGRCLFEPNQRRTARRSYAFEMFRLLSRLANLRLVAGGAEWSLSPEQTALVAADFGRQKKISYASIRKLLDLDPRTRFAGVAPEEEGRDAVARTGNAAEGTKALRDAVGEGGWRVLMGRPEQRDRIAEILTFRESTESIQAGLVECGVESDTMGAVIGGVEAGKFARFAGAGHISAQAARTLIPPLSRGLMYSDACTDVGYDHAAQAETDLADIRNPVVRKAIGEMVKQVRAIVRTYGLPDAIHVELARNLGKSAEERDKITRGIEDANKRRDKVREQLRELLAREPVADEVLRYELWKEQGGRCLYSDQGIEPAWIAAADNRVQVDHILPWSRFGDDSFRNKALCLAKANQDKRGRTPFEWFSEDKSDDEWAGFSARVHGCKEMKSGKKSGFYLRRNAKEVEERFKNRNLNDTRYATRLLHGLLGRIYPEADIRARPGQLTAKLRRAWGLEFLKKGPDGKRLNDDRHHALDAIVVAATTQAMLQGLTRAAQAAERLGDPRGFDLGQVPAPDGFRAAAHASVERVFVSRPERRRVPGEAHAATIPQVRTIGGEELVFERKPVEELEIGDLDRIPVPEPYGRIADPAKLRDEMVAELRGWIEAGRPKNEPPRSPKGDPIRKVRVQKKDKVRLRLRGGTVDRGDMARVDVFSRMNSRGRREFFLTPIYPHHVADRERFPQPPSCVISGGGRDESDWKNIDSNFVFMFSLFQHSLLEVIKSDGEVIAGYFKGVDVNTAAIRVASTESLQRVRKGIGVKTLRGFSKLSVDRLGNRSTIEWEIRTWHGAACI